MIDLHVHSTFSDGSRTPAELVSEAVAAGLTALAVTDHDTMAGVPELVGAAGGTGVRPVPGVELSVAHEHGPLHLLGYFMEPGDELNAALERIRRGREERNLAIVDRLVALGAPVTWEEVLAIAGGDLVGRPHFAMALVARGHVPTKDDAFARYLARGRPAYVERFRYPAAGAIGILRRARGAAVLAHPGLLRCEGRHLKELVAELAAAGLAGIEAWHSRHTAVQVRRLRRLAALHGLVATGGSDYHGAMSPGIRIGRGFGSLAVPDDVVDALLALR
ncbi:MAG: PHP domain-containing protein [Lentisphaerae bacterium]|nr:PHP domain-containing protein [Lentisphaerota bacterium]